MFPGSWLAKVCYYNYRKIGGKLYENILTGRLIIFPLLRPIILHLIPYCRISTESLRKRKRWHSHYWKSWNTGMME